MLWLIISLIVVGAIILIIYIIEKIKSYSVKEVLIKFIVSLLFVIVASLSSYHKSNHILSPFIIIGLLLGLSGDIWLDLKYVYPKDDKLYTYAGFIVFGIGHILYVTGLYLEFFNNSHFLYVLIPIFASIVLGIANLFLSKLLKLDFKGYKWIVFTYSILLFSTPLSALSLLIIHSFNNITLMMMFIGGILFALSDLVLSNTYFGNNHEKPIDFILNYLFYYSAQYLIAFSLFFI